MPSRNDQQWGSLSSFLGAYLNQDFLVDYGGVWETVDAFRGEESRERAHRVSDDIDDLLARVADDDELYRTIVRLGSGYAPQADGWRISSWLREL